MKPYGALAARPAAPTTDQQQQIAVQSASSRGTVLLSVDGTDQDNLRVGMALWGLALLGAGFALGRWSRR
jgi:hypothetical protein